MHLAAKNSKKEEWQEEKWSVLWSNIESKYKKLKYLSREKRTRI